MQIPYLSFDRQSWCKFRHDTALTLSESEVLQLKGQNEPISLLEVEEIYLPLSRLINLYVSAAQKLYGVTTQFLGHPEPKVPYLIGIAGSVAVGKSTTARILQALLSRGLDHPQVALVTTDGFLYPNAVLKERGLMDKKGFPESYDTKALITFLSNVKAGKSDLKVPVYSHHHYDIVGEFLTLGQPDIVIVEGLNILQVPTLKRTKELQWVVSDFFNFTIYVDAETEVIYHWFIERFMKFREKSLHEVEAFFHQFSQWSDETALEFAKGVWQQINERNLLQNILPFKNRARLILEKAADHSIQKVWLRKL